MPLARRMGTAEKEVLNKLANEVPGSTWSRRSGVVLYENNALTEMLCSALAQRGLLNENTTSGQPTVYTLNPQGLREADSGTRGFIHQGIR